MKKNPKFHVFSTIYLPNLLTLLSTAVLFVCIVLSAAWYISHNMNSDFVSNAVSLGTKSALSSSESIAETMLHIAMPSVSLTKAEKINFEDPTYPAEATVETTSGEANVSITYQSAEEEGYKSMDGIYISNQSGKNVDIAALLNKNLDLSLSSQPSVLIVHTHTTESYTPSEQYNYTSTDTDRTQDENYNMVSVGNIIYEELKSRGINVIHDKTINDYPSYSKSYSKSLKLVESYMEKYPSIKIVIDVHRDAIISSNGSKLRPVTSFDSSASQVMLVIGTDASGLNHPTWETNLSFALKLQYKMNELYPSLARPINLRKQRFNQHSAPYCFILEVGSNGNTLEEAKKGAEYFSRALISLLKV